MIQNPAIFVDADGTHYAYDADNPPPIGPVVSVAPDATPAERDSRINLFFETGSADPPTPTVMQRVLKFLSEL